MRAIAVFPGEKALRVIDHPPPRLEAASEVRLRMLDIGVCGTDREIARFEYGTPPPGAPYLVLGHESLGEVVEVGGEVGTIRTGDLVVTMVRRPCQAPDCPACAVGRPDFCLTGRFTERGISGRHGFMTEEVVDDQRYMIVVPEALRGVGVLLEPLTIAEKALIEVGDVQDRLPWLGAQGSAAPGQGSGQAAGTGRTSPAQNAVVLGAGPVGLLGALALRVRGFETWVYSREPGDDPKARWVESVGAHYLSSTAVPIERVADAIGNIDLVYEATGASGIAFKALAILGVNGVFILTGVPGPATPIEIDADLIMRNLVLKNQLVYGTVNAGRDAFEAGVQDLLAFHQRWPDQLQGLITGRYAPEACQDLLLGPPAGIKRVVSFSPRDGR